MDTRLPSILVVRCGHVTKSWPMGWEPKWCVQFLGPAFEEDTFDYPLLCFPSCWLHFGLCGVPSCRGYSVCNSSQIYILTNTSVNEADIGSNEARGPRYKKMIKLTSCLWGGKTNIFEGIGQCWSRSGTLEPSKSNYLSSPIYPFVQLP